MRRFGRVYGHRRPIAAVVALTTVATALALLTPTSLGSLPAGATGSTLSGVKQVSAGLSVSCALTNDNKLWCWGNNAHGGLGNGSTAPSAYPVQVVTTSGPLAGKTITQISAADERACAVAADGAAACWGYNPFGQNGTGDNVSSSLPVAVSKTANALAGKSIAQISTAHDHTCAATTDGVATCWGGNGNGQLGNGTYTRSNTASAVSTSGTALQGKVVDQVSTSNAHTCAHATDGTLACWGFGGDGQLGNGFYTGSSTPVSVQPLPGRSYTSVSAGDYFTCATANDWAAYCFGKGTDGQLGDGVIDVQHFVSTPTAVTTVGTPLDHQGIAEIEAGIEHTCARTTASVLACWGKNNAGSLGNGSITTVAVATRVTTAGTPLAGKTLVQVDGGFTTRCAVATDGTLACWGGNVWGQVGNGLKATSSIPVAAVGGPMAGLHADQLVSSDGSACTRVAATVRCWGDNGRGQVGIGTKLNTALPVPISTSGAPLSGKTITSISAGGASACALAADSTMACWGAGTAGNLGSGAFADSLSPVAVVTAGTPLAGKTIAQMKEIKDHACAVATDGTLACWGANTYGQLGNGSKTSANKPTAVTVAGTPLEDKTVSQIVGGLSHTCVLTTDSIVACWGDNGVGQLGTGTTTDSLVPIAPTFTGTPLDGKTIVELTSGGDHVCARATDGTAACWGYNGYGQLGTGNHTSQSTATAIPVAGTPLLGATIAHISASYALTCATTTQGTAACWGLNTYGATGTGSAAADVLIPTALAVAGTPLEGKTIESMALGSLYGCAQTTDGTISCWGGNLWSQFGNGDVPYVATPGSVISGQAATAPGAPTIGTATRGNGQVTLTWTAPASDGGSPISSYTITPSIGAAAQTPVTSTGTATSKTITGLTNGTTYTFTVAAVNAVGTSTASAASPAVTPATVPGAPTIGTATRGDGQVTLTWTAPAADGGSPISSYTITPSIGTAAQTPVTSTGTATSKTITGLTNGTTYTFTVAAVNAVGTSTASAASPAVSPAKPYAPFASWSAFVTRQHNDVLGRAPTATELTSWDDALSSGAKTPGDLVDELRRSAENTTNVDPTARLYRAFLGRAPDAGGLKFWIGRRRFGNWSLTKMADSFASSNEFTTKYGSLTNRQFVTRIYTDVLGRTADQAGVDYWTKKLDTKTKTRGGVMIGFSESSEYKRKQAENTDVSVGYIFLLGRVPTAPESTEWVTRQKAGTTHVTLLDELLGSADYTTRTTG